VVDLGGFSNRQRLIRTILPKLSESFTCSAYEKKLRTLIVIVTPSGSSSRELQYVNVTSGSHRWNRFSFAATSRYSGAYMT